MGLADYTEKIYEKYQEILLTEGLSPAKKKQLSKLLAQQKDLRAKKKMATPGRKKQINAKLKAIGAKVSAIRAMKKGGGTPAEKPAPEKPVAKAPDTDKTKEAAKKKEYDRAMKKRRAGVQAAHKTFDRAAKAAGLDKKDPKMLKKMEKGTGMEFTKGTHKNIERQKGREARAAKRKARGLKGRVGRATSFQEQKEINEMEFKKTYMKYMSQGSGGSYKMKQSPDKTKEPEKWQGDGGYDEKPVTEGKGSPEYNAYVKELLKKKGISNLGDLSDEETKAFFAEVDKGWKAKNEAIKKPEMDRGGKTTEYPMKSGPDKKKKPKDGWQGDTGGTEDAEGAIKALGESGLKNRYTKAGLDMSGGFSKYEKLYEAYNNVKAYPQQDAKGGSKTEYPMKNKPNKKKKPKDGWQGDDGGVSDVVEMCGDDHKDKKKKKK